MTHPARSLAGALLCVVTIPVFSQLRISGLVLNRTDDAPLSFVAIGVLGTDVGTITDEDGTFTVRIPHALIEKKLLVSALGYERVSLSIDSLRQVNYPVIRLDEKIVELNPVTVRARRRGLECGVLLYNGGCFYADTARTGAAVALLITNQLNNKRPAHTGLSFPSYIESAAVRIVNNTFPEFKVRFRIFSVDSITGRPGVDLFEKSIVSHGKMENGFLRFDLSSYNILVPERFYVVFEWILESSDRVFLHQKYAAWARAHPDLLVVSYTRVGDASVPYVNLRGTLQLGTPFGISTLPQIVNGNTCYFRYSSFGSWYLSPGTLAATVRLSK